LVRFKEKLKIQIYVVFIISLLFSGLAKNMKIKHTNTKEGGFFEAINTMGGQ